MNQYGRDALSYYRQHRPQAYRRIEEPVKFFTTLGEEIADEISEMTEELLERDLLTADYLGNLAVWNRAKSAATEIVLEMRHGEPEVDD